MQPCNLAGLFLLAAFLHSCPSKETKEVNLLEASSYFGKVTIPGKQQGRGAGITFNHDGCGMLFIQPFNDAFSFTNMQWHINGDSLIVTEAADEGRDGEMKPSRHGFNLQSKNDSTLHIVSMWEYTKLKRFIKLQTPPISHPFRQRATHVDLVKNTFVLRKAENFNPSGGSILLDLPLPNVTSGFMQMPEDMISLDELNHGTRWGGLEAPGEVCAMVGGICEVFCEQK